MAPVAFPLVLLLASLAVRCQAGSRKTDAELLLAFKASLDNGDTALASWNTSDPCVGADKEGKSSWRGVWCSGNRVVGM